MKKKRNSFRTKLLMSFSVMLFLPIMLATVNFLWSRDVLEEETLKYNQALLGVAQNVVDEQLQNIQLYALGLSENEVVTEVLKEEEDAGERMIKIQYVRGQLMRMRSRYPGVKSVVIYSVPYKMGISNSTVCREEWPVAAVKLLREDTYWQTNPLTAVEENMVKYLSEENLYCKYIDFETGEGKECETRVLLINSLPVWNSGISYDGVFLAEIDMEMLLSEFGRSVAEAGGVLGIMDQQGKVIASVGDAELLRSLGNRQKSEGGSRIQDRREYYIVNSCESNLNRWTYVMIQPDTFFVRKLQQNLNFTIVVLMVLLLLGIFLVYGLSRSTYKPLKEIMNRLRERSGRKEQKNEADEFLYIETVLDEMEQSVFEVQAMMHRELPRIRNNLLQSLLMNTVTDYEEYLSRLKDCGVIFEREAFVVAVVHVAVFPTEQLEKQALLKLLLWEQIREIMGDDVSCCMVDMPGDNQILIINGEEEYLKNERREFLHVLMERARKEQQLLLVIAVSTPVTQIEQISAAYQETLNRLGNQLGKEEFGSVFMVERQKRFQLYHCPMEVRNQISNAIMSGNVEQACLVLDRNYQENFENRQVSHAVAVSYFIMLIDTILNGYSVSEEEKQRLWDAYNPVAALLVEKTPKDMALIVKGFAQLVGHYVRQRREDSADSMKRRILNYIKSEYGNNDLSLSYVAENFLITPNYLSAFFKEQIGDTFLNYLTRVRVEQAKRLLLETDYPVNQIAEKVGYASSNTFIRTFKKLENMTPGEYRESARQRARF